MCSGEMAYFCNYDIHVCAIFYVHHEIIPCMLVCQFNDELSMKNSLLFIGEPCILKDKEVFSKANISVVRRRHIPCGQFG